MFAGMSIKSIKYMRAKESDIVSNSELVYENILKSILKLSETSVQIYDDIHNIVNNIKQNKAIATQVRVVVLKIPIEKISSFVIAMLPTKGKFNATEIYNFLTNVIIMS
ncbi:hypothetical protein C1645_837225 [Glomus cerebriforme]|uniref:Uncharacterized protein n=1 Tax=Glomus cerebriforme TaxID=658196 RepID=A0A397S981_9GLOM|nr:hypothetical protein C1645_837225 [Glomus cerebriforme]